MFTGTARVIYDEAPDEVSEHEGEMVHELRRFTERAREEVLLSTPYLVIDDSPMHSMRGIIARGVTARLLTNSLESIESELPYSGYRKDRRDILDTGIELYELRADAASHDLSDTPPVEAQWLALHAKLLIVDRELLYVGTFNIDPRSAFINSEMGLLIDSPELAEAVAQILDRDMGPENAWRVRLDENGREYWESSDGRTYDAPSRGFGQNLADFFFGLLPIEDQL
jgi:putative cardiolipin synthase